MISSAKVQTGFKVHTTSSLMGIVAIFPEIKRPRRETGQSSSSVKVKNESSCPLHSAFHHVMHIGTFTFTILCVRGKICLRFLTENVNREG
jgi:hypothetical protein